MHIAKRLLDKDASITLIHRSISPQVISLESHNLSRDHVIVSQLCIGTLRKRVLRALLMIWHRKQSQKFSHRGENKSAVWLRQRRQSLFFQCLEKTPTRWCAADNFSKTTVFTFPEICSTNRIVAIALGNELFHAQKNIHFISVLLTLCRKQNQKKHLTRLRWPLSARLQRSQNRPKF